EVLIGGEQPERQIQLLERDFHRPTVGFSAALPRVESDRDRGRGSKYWRCRRQPRQIGGHAPHDRSSEQEANRQGEEMFHSRLVCHPAVTTTLFLLAESRSQGEGD